VTSAADGVVERYFELLVAHDFDRLADLLTDDIVRVGPFGDVKSPLVPYLEFLADLMPRLPGYSLEQHRILYAGNVAVAEITETIELDGAKHITPEALVFDLTDDGRIRRIQIYIQRISSSLASLRSDELKDLRATGEAGPPSGVFSAPAAVEGAFGAE
jgi:hypothetical protein